jgi:hypothetical protein
VVLDGPEMQRLMLEAEIEERRAAMQRKERADLIFRWVDRAVLWGFLGFLGWVLASARGWLP